MSGPYHLFERFGVELEYMIVERDGLGVHPLADEVLKAACGSYAADVELGPLAWSNELVLHVIELKTNGPAERLDGLEGDFQHDVRRINQILEPLDACLMPTAMHPWMDPARETKLWPHEANAIYAAFDRIFNCRGHGWSNLQSTHLNLPFCGDEEFGRLHAAIRLLLPILPALAASSPIFDGTVSPWADARLEFYRNNARRIPSVTGSVVPERVFTTRSYQQQILQRIYDDVAPYDPEGILRYEWLNARGAIARFDRNTIEIRLLDMQECPAADLAVLALIVSALQGLVQERWCTWRQQKAWEVEPLERILLSTIRDAERAVIAPADYPSAFGLQCRDHCTAADLWRHLFETAMPASWKEQYGSLLRVIIDEGPLSRRIVRSLGEEGGPPERLTAVYHRLCACLAHGHMFTSDRQQQDGLPARAQYGTSVGGDRQ